MGADRGPRSGREPRRRDLRRRDPNPTTRTHTESLEIAVTDLLDSLEADERRDEPIFGAEGASLGRLLDELPYAPDGPIWQGGTILGVGDPEPLPRPSDAATSIDRRHDKGRDEP